MPLHAKLGTRGQNGHWVPPMVSSQKKQEPHWPEEANVERLNLAPTYSDSALIAHLSPRVMVSLPGWLLP